MLIDKLKIDLRPQDSTVVEGQDCFYKVQALRADDESVAFLLAVRQAIVNEYASQGLDWKFSTEAKGDVTYSIEKREKMEVLDGSQSFEEVMLASRDIKRRIENRLEFPNLLSQLNKYEQFERVRKIELVFDGEGDPANYARKNDKVFFLGDSSCFFALINDAGKWEKNINNVEVPVKLTYGNFIFTGASSLNSSEPVHQRIFSISPKWWLFPISEREPSEQQDGVADDLETMFDNNAKVLATGEKIPLKTLEDLVSD